MTSWTMKTSDRGDCDVTYEEMLIENEEVIVKEKALRSSDGRIKGNKIAIRKDIETDTEKGCVLAEELGHWYTTSGNILNQEKIENRKQEYRARLHGFNLKIGLMGLVRAFEHGCRSASDIAEYLDVTEEYLKEAVDCYRSKYGVYATVDNYAVYFTPALGVLKID